MTGNTSSLMRRYAGKALVGTMGVLLVGSLAVLGGSLTDTGPTLAQAQAGQEVTQLEADLVTAQSALQAEHDVLLNSLPGVNVERIRRDQATGRALLLGLTDASASTRTIDETRAVLDARYEVFDAQSQALSVFLPDWVKATRGAGTAYTLAELDIDLSDTQARGYSYVGLARLDSVSASGGLAVDTQYVVLIYSTEASDGTVISLEAHRLSDRSREALAAADSTDTDTDTGNNTDEED